MIVIQRVRVRWGADARGSQHAKVRSGLPDAFTLPAHEPCDVLVHDVLLDADSAYQPDASIGYGMPAVRAAGIWLDPGGDVVVVERLPGRQAYPIQRRTQHLFTLHKGQTGRYLANFRFTGCACAPQWYYEQWTTHVSFADRIDREAFIGSPRHHDVDQRVHLYGGQRRVSRKSPHPVR